MRPRVQLLTLLVAIVCDSLAYADPHVVDRGDHSRLGATIGLFTPTGEVGLEYAQALHPNVEIAVGAGAGLVRVGPQGSLMPRVRMRRGAFTVSLGAGVSAGRYNNISAFQDETAPHIMCLFGNVEIGIQATWHRGLFARFFLGGAMILAHGDYDETDAAQRRELDEKLPYGGLTGGWAF